jgi:hypothetical protein
MTILTQHQLLTTTFNGTTNRASRLALEGENAENYLRASVKKISENSINTIIKHSYHVWISVDGFHVAINVENS